MRKSMLRELMQLVWGHTAGCETKIKIQIDPIGSVQPNQNFITDPTPTHKLTDLGQVI